MKPEEAIEMIQTKLTCMKLDRLSCIEEGCSRNCDDCEYNYKQGTMGEQEEALRTAIEALKEVQQYREIGTVEECREAVEKQTPKKPVKDKYHHNCCPNCGWIVSGEGGYGEEFCPHCENCGQAIKWENLEGMEDE